tara:strand:- start:316 stop:519 length:204 start_codon:yes stop_codon:yes gene_type:complete
MSKIRALSDKDLIQYKANAKTTGMECLGHTKSASNKNLVEQYDEEIARRNLLYPDDIKGVFNGKGSW